MNINELIGRRFFRCLCLEKDYHNKSRRYLSRKDLHYFNNYYRKYSMDNYEHYAFLYALKLKDMINLILSSPSPPTILDAGCGVGTESLLFSSLGANVVGIDLEEKFVNIARKRVDYYDNVLGVDNAPKFFLKNALEYKGSFDHIWAHNFISHVGSIKDFVRLSFENLNWEGTLTICDGNKFNPYVCLTNAIVHLISGKYVYRQNPNGIGKVKCVIEVSSTPYYIIKLLATENFSKESIRIFGYLPTTLSNKNIRTKQVIEQSLSKIPLFNQLGVFYAITGRKRN